MLRITNIIAFLLIFLILAGSICLSMFSFVVEDYEQAFLQSFKKIERVEGSETEFKVFQPGRHFKVPFVDSVKYIDTRERVFSQTDEFVTALKKTLIIEYFVPWRIADPQKYYLATKGNEDIAIGRMARKLREAVRNEIGNYKILEISTGAIATFEAENEGLNVTSKKSKDSRSYIESVEGRREQILSDIYSNVAPDILNDLGIEIKATEFANISLPSEVSKVVYERMAKERRAIATKFIKNGEQQASAIRSEANLTASNTISVAENEAIATRKKADAEVAKIYSNAYKEAPEFYEFYLALETLPETFTKDDVFLLSTDSQFMRHLKGE